MSNHKKTRQEKIIADLHRKLQSVAPQSSLATSSQEKISRSSFSVSFTTPTVSQRTVSYTYLAHEVKKITFVTMTIILFESLLFFLLHNHIVVLPFISF